MVSTTTTTKNLGTMVISSEMFYFLAGALLPTLAYAMFSSSRKRVISEKKDGERTVREEEDDDDDDENDDDGSEENIPTGGNSSKWGISDSPYKMVLCVNTQLGMGKGKIAAQCSHAAVGCYKRASVQCPNALLAWEHTGCAKIAVKCPSEDELEVILVEAKERDVPVYLVEDAGRTQIAAGSRTVLGLGPAPCYVFEGLTSHLKLM